VLNTEVEITEVLANFREIIGVQAQEIATLRAVIKSLKEQQVPLVPESPRKKED
jgi:hypothetical protein